MKATPEMIAAAWRAFAPRLHGQKLEPGPGFREAIQAALDVSAIIHDVRNEALEEAAKVAKQNSWLHEDHDEWSAGYSWASLNIENEIRALKEPTL